MGGVSSRALSEGPKKSPHPDLLRCAQSIDPPHRFAGGGIRSALLAGAALLLLALTSPAFAQEPEARSYRAYIESLRPLALERGVTRETFDRALTDVPYDTEVSRLSRRQPEYGRPVGEYLNSLVAQPRLSNGIKRIGELRGLLDSIEHTFGVPREVIVAIWGIETGYGANQGGKRVIPSLATLAFLNYKGDFARDELITALRILQDGHIPQERMIGSWAGAMGQPQFIPSSFMRWAVDFSGDGKRDLWTSVPDVLASIANYLNGHGWQRGRPWGFQVLIPDGFDYRTSRGDFRDWSALGLRRADGGTLPASGSAILFFPSGARGPAFLVTKNFDVIKTYNISDVYALAVLHLADRFRGAAPFTARWP
ncbi:MAG TPA: lytic murein transglycosylase, partial [Hyphomicrobiaceae bacterium]|nr:lytic murein transglycosylase [Hyphomicrobiaceae bacterium]